MTTVDIHVLLNLQSKQHLQIKTKRTAVTSSCYVILKLENQHPQQRWKHPLALYFGVSPKV